MKMRDRVDHLSDQELVLAADGELSGERARHLAGCESCRARGEKLKNAASLVRMPSLAIATIFDVDSPCGMMR